jgi:hypothetical protein
MTNSSGATRLLAQEARALLTRLGRLKPFSLQMPMVLAATVPPAAQAAVEGHMIRTRRRLRSMVLDYIRRLHGPGRRPMRPDVAQRSFAMLRLRFNAVISQFEIFAEVLTQRCQHETGVWIAGLDDLAADALVLPGVFYNAPPVICYLDRSLGAAIRRARTRLPGGSQSPVAIISVPRERMVGSGIASSLVHEVGHQGADLLGLVKSLRPEILEIGRRRCCHQQLAWHLWERWIGEIVADFWSVAKLGIGATRGVMNMVSLPRAFMFRVDGQDPHPMPWIRVKLSCAMGRVLYPHPQWDRLANLWESLYPLSGLDTSLRGPIDTLEFTLPAFVDLLINHRPPTLGGRSLKEVIARDECQPDRLAAAYRPWRESPKLMRTTAPSLSFAIIGQARADGRMSPDDESVVVAELLTYWAMRSALDTSILCAAQPGRTPERRPVGPSRLAHPIFH